MALLMLLVEIFPYQINLLLLCITDGATIASPTFTGTPAAPTAASGLIARKLLTALSGAITPFAEIDAAAVISLILNLQLLHFGHVDKFARSSI